MAANSFAGDAGANGIELVNTRSTTRRSNVEIEGDITLPASRFIYGGQTAKYDFNAVYVLG